MNQRKNDSRPQMGAKLSFLCFFLCLIGDAPISFAQNNPILGGQQIDISQAPYQVSIESVLFGGGHNCGGSIINSEWVLTAGHCVLFDNVDGLIVHAGATDQTNNSIGQRIQVDKKIFAPGFTLINFPPDIILDDVALIHLATPLCFNENVQPIVYATPENTSTDMIAPGKEVFITGWGDSGGGCCTDLLQGVTIPIISNADANTKITDPSNNCVPVTPNPVDNNMIAFFKPGMAAGHGDSGGPAVIKGPNGIPILIGAADWGGCPNENFPSIYANLRNFSNFISSTVSQHEPPCTCPPFNTDIYTNTLYNVDMDMPGDIYVHSGAELLIEARIGMRQGTRILVEQNARLVIDNGGVVTKGCDAPDWAGIQVLGNNQKAQPEKDAPLTDPDQAGIVWIDNGTVEWARAGVSAGGGYGQEYWGGLIWTNKATFQKNRKDVEFMSYKFSANKSRFNKTHFWSGLPTALANTEGITIWETDGIEFNECEIYSKGQEGIRTYDASIKVSNGCKIEGNQYGISSYATYPMSYTSTIGALGVENSFYGNKYDIFASLVSGFAGIYNPNGKFSMDVINNTFEGSSYGVILDGPSNFRVGGNKFTDVGISTWVANTGYNNLINQNLVGCNTIVDRGNIGILAIGENREMHFLANDFNLAYPSSRDFILSNSFSLLNNGTIAEMQGYPLAAAENCFSDPGNQPDITTMGATNSFTYYYKSTEAPPGCDPEPLTPGNYSKVGVSNPLYTVDCSGFGGLPPGLPNPTPGDLNTRRNAMLQLLPTIGSSPNAKAQYYQLMAEKEAILKYLVVAALSTQQYTNAENLLAGEQTQAANWAIFGLRMSRKDYTGASQWLQQLSFDNETALEFRNIQQINLARLQNPASFTLSPAQESFLNSVADGYSPVRGYARGLLGLLKDQRYYPEQFEMRELPQENAKQVLPGEIRVYPSPAKNYATILWPESSDEGQSEVQVFDLLGKCHLSKTLDRQISSFTFDTSSLNDGIFLAVVKNSGKTVYQVKFSIHH